MSESTLKHLQERCHFACAPCLGALYYSHTLHGFTKRVRTFTAAVSEAVNSLRYCQARYHSATAGFGVGTEADWRILDFAAEAISLFNSTRVHWYIAGGFENN